VRRLVYLTSARRDIDSIFDFIAHENNDTAMAERHIEQIDAQCRRLALSPIVLGRPRNDLRQGLRSFPFKSLLIFFFCLPDKLQIVNIINAARDIDALFNPADD
jgi:toxin ParE1/3/4